MCAPPFCRLLALPPPVGLLAWFLLAFAFLAILICVVPAHRHSPAACVSSSVLFALPSALLGLVFWLGLTAPRFAVFVRRLVFSLCFGFVAFVFALLLLCVGLLICDCGVPRLFVVLLAPVCWRRIFHAFLRAAVFTVFPFIARSVPAFLFAFVQFRHYAPVPAAVVRLGCWMPVCGVPVPGVTSF